MPPQLEAHYQMVLRALVEGRVIPLLGAGVNRCGRPDGTAWDHGRYAPDGAELSRYLAQYAAYPGPNTADLVRVSQYVAVMLGAGPLYDELHDVFNARLPADADARVPRRSCPPRCAAAGCPPGTS